MDIAKTYSRVTSCCNKEVSYNRGEKPKTCPHCGGKFWDKPTDERDLFLLQERYIQSGRDKKILAEMYVLLFAYSKNMILSRIRKKVVFTPHHLQEKTEDLATTFIELYLKNPEYEIKNSFGGMLKKISNGILYRNKDNDRVESYDKKISGTNLSLSDKLYDIIDDDSEVNNDTEMAYEDMLNGMRENDLQVELNDLIDMIYLEFARKGNGFHKRLQYLLGLKFFFKGETEKFFIDYYSQCGNDVRDAIEKTKIVLRQYLISNDVKR
jgi:hypothetical protein